MYFKECIKKDCNEVPSFPDFFSKGNGQAIPPPSTYSWPL